jgi:hypothetical protein
MKRKTLLAISFTISIIGLAVLYFLKPDISPQSLQLSGTVKRVFQKENVAFISFVPDNMTVVSFEGDVSESGYHTLVGRLQQYDGKVEFVVEEIK